MGYWPRPYPDYQAGYLGAAVFGHLGHSSHQSELSLEHYSRLTKQEVKDEMRQSEGDPHVKDRVRKLQREMAERRMMQEVPKADVVITNPTHVAVALKYDRLKMFTPVVVAKGYDEVAQRIKELGREHDIVQVENVTLARALAKEVDIGRAMPTK
jgi:flagellar biosynthesis protein FlhB